VAKRRGIGAVVRCGEMYKYLTLRGLSALD
jgi:hypothetical protein